MKKIQAMPAFLYAIFLTLFLSSNALYAKEELEGESLQKPASAEEASQQKEFVELKKKQLEEEYKNEQNDCYQKMLVNDCLVAAKKRYSATSLQIRKIENQIVEFEREQRRAASKEREAKRNAEAQNREKEQQKTAESYRSTEAQKAAERAYRLAEKEKQAEQGRNKLANERAERQARRAKKDAEIAQKRAKREQKEQISPR